MVLLPADFPRPLKRAMQEAKDSTFRYQLGAVITNKKTVVGKGCNSRRYHRLHSFYNWRETLHAEAAAVLNSNQNLLRDATVHVARINKEGEPLLAMPCSCCINMLIFVGIRRAIFTCDYYPYYIEMYL